MRRERVSGTGGVGNLWIPGGLLGLLLGTATFLAFPGPAEGQASGEDPSHGHPSSLVLTRGLSGEGPVLNPVGPGGLVLSQDLGLEGPVLNRDLGTEGLVVNPLQAREEPVSTRATFIRAFLVPGWGHVMTESYLRGGFWVAAQGGSWWMLWKSVSRRKEARRLREVELDVAVDRYRARGVMDPDSLTFLAENDPALEAWDTLLERRDEQVEDWVALSLSVMLLGAVDAFVSAHLMDFPEPLTLDVGPRQGIPLDIRRPGVEVRLSVPSSTLGELLSLRRAP
jgi:hypothetical protein